MGNLLFWLGIGAAQKGASPKRQHCLADDAVNCEPVSASKFPANREINREFRRVRHPPRFTGLINARIQ